MSLVPVFLTVKLALLQVYWKCNMPTPADSARRISWLQVTCT